MARHSPCIGICRLDDATGYCLGCGRTGAEVGDWMAMSESQRDAVWENLPARLKTLSVRVRLLPWTRDELVNWIRDKLVARQGTWTTGEPPALASFDCSGTPLDIRVDADTIIAARTGSAFCLTINEKIRAFSFSDGGPIVLVLPRGRAALPLASTIQSLGPDTGSIRLAHRNDAIFDMGMGLHYARSCVRTSDPALSTSLEAMASQRASNFSPAILEQMSAAGAHLVVESAAARIEIYDENWLTYPPGRGLRTSERDGKAKLELPTFAVPIATFHPV